MLYSYNKKGKLLFKALLDYLTFSIGLDTTLGRNIYFPIRLRSPV